MSDATRKAVLELAAARRAANKIRGWHHHAVRTKDMVATREFYEGILGMPLVGTWVENYDVNKKMPSNYMHCFFELGDGSSLAFFQFEEGMREDPMPMPRDPYEHHVALAVETVADAKAIKHRLDEHGLANWEVDHGYCFSVYTSDPNGMIVEVATFVPNGESILAAAADTAEADMQSWLQGVRATNNQWRGRTKLD